MDLGKGTRYVIVVAGFIAAIPLFFLVVNSRAFLQGRKKVVIREGGNLRLGPPQPDGGEASQDLPFAQLSGAAYEALLKEKDGGIDPPKSEADLTLEGEHWKKWDFPSGPTQTEYLKYNLRVEIWGNPSLNAVAVVFGGQTPKHWLTGSPISGGSSLIIMTNTPRSLRASSNFSQRNISSSNGSLIMRS